MTVTSTGHLNPTRFFGLSTDTKPTSAMINSTFYETDTRHRFLYDGAEWVRSDKVTVEQADAISVKGTVTTNDLLAAILTELEISNAYLAIVTGTVLDEDCT